MIKSFQITSFALEAVVAFIDNNEIIAFEPLFEVFDDFTTDFFVLDYAFV